MNKAFLDNGGFVHVVLEGEQTTDSVEWALQEASVVAARVSARGGRVRVLFDRSAARGLSTRAKDVAESLLISMHADRVAVVGVVGFQAHVANLRARSSGRGETYRTFSGAAEARLWLTATPARSFSPGKSTSTA